jgi:hypothetical protein
MTELTMTLGHHQAGFYHQASNMDATQWYAASVISAGVCCLLATFLTPLVKFGRYLIHFLARHLVYRYIVERHAFIGPWSMAYVLLQVVFWAVNILCVCFESTDLAQVGLRAGTMALTNLLSLGMSLQSDRLARALGLNLRTWREIHCSMGFVAFALAAAHVAIAGAIDRATLSSLPQHPFLIAVGQSDASITS